MDNAFCEASLSAPQSLRLIGECTHVQKLNIVTTTISELPHVGIELPYYIPDQYAFEYIEVCHSWCYECHGRTDLLSAEHDDEAMNTTYQELIVD